MTVGRRIALTLAASVLIGVPILSGIVSITPLLAVAQEPSTPVVFEVAAVKRNTSGERAARIETPPGGRFVATNAPLRILILRAYGILDSQLVGAPDWALTERFDVNAKLEQEPPAVPPGQPDARRLATRSLLAERFKLVVHLETRQVPMYALVMGSEDRKPGPMLTPASGLCRPENAEKRRAAVAAGNSSVCGTRLQFGRIQIGGRPLSDFARGLSDVPDLARTVIDRTGLTGDWNLDLTFTPDRQPAIPGQDAPTIDPHGPSLSAALHEQLGLKLESIRGPLEVLVVDRVERLDVQDRFEPRH
jgi:uncharacterized protein (TIGR03435 family)